MITIDFNIFSFEHEEMKQSCIEYVQNVAGTPGNITIRKEDEEDPESEYSVHIHYPEYTLDKFEYYDELMDFARENELYVIVYDHDTKNRKGYWYDEEEDWIQQDLSPYNEVSPYGYLKWLTSQSLEDEYFNKIH